MDAAGNFSSLDYRSDDGFVGQGTLGLAAFVALSRLTKGAIILWQVEKGR